MRHVLLTLLATAVLGLAAAAAFIFSGAYDVGADMPHAAPIHWAIETTRRASVAARVRNIFVPPLDSPRMILEGAGQYAAMCSTCHLAPGFDSNETQQGLYPQPPKLASVRIAPAEIFWAVKHGIKMSGMPAWGKTHTDQEIWAITAFVTKLPTLDADQYRKMVAAAPPDEDMQQMPMPGGHAMGGD